MLERVIGENIEFSTTLAAELDWIDANRAAPVRLRPARSGTTPSRPGASTGRRRRMSICCAPRASTSRRARAGCRPPSCATLGRRRAGAGALRRVRRGARQLAAGGAVPRAARGAAPLGGRPHRPALDARHRPRWPACWRRRRRWSVTACRARSSFFGEPAEKVCGSKPIHAAKGYYDGCRRLHRLPPLAANTVVWETHFGAYWSAVFTFECREPERWIDRALLPHGAARQRAARCPGAIDALMPDVHHHQVHQGGDVPAHRHLDAQRVHPGGRRRHLRQPAAALRPDPVRLARARPRRSRSRSTRVLEQNARHAAAVTGCEVSVRWVTKTRVGLPNHAMADLTYENLELVGAAAIRRRGAGSSAARSSSTSASSRWTTPSRRDRRS